MTMDGVGWLSSPANAKEKDIGVPIIQADLKVSEQWHCSEKGNQLLGMIRRNIAYREKKLIVQLFKAIVRPRLECCIQARRPHLRNDIDQLERLQRRANTIIRRPFETM